MICEKIQLRKENENVYLKTYVPDSLNGYKRIADALLIMPGGGYEFLSDREAEPIALEFASKGYAVFVLYYSVKDKAVFPNPLIDASLAMSYIKNNTNKYSANPDRIFALGFSAGGHLAASLGVLWNNPELYQKTGIKPGDNKPKGVLPIYPVISANVDGAHMGSFYNITGTTNPSREELDRYSLEKSVNADTVPMYIVHTSTDLSVSVHNSLALATALKNNNIQFEMHIFPDAPHGMSLCNEITSMGDEHKENHEYAKWVDMAQKWIKSVK